LRAVQDERRRRAIGPDAPQSASARLLSGYVAAERPVSEPAPASGSSASEVCHPEIPASTAPPSSADPMPANQLAAPPPAPAARASAMRPPSVDDFRRNAERQSKEQKAVGSILAWVSYSLIGAVLLIAGLAGLGGWTLYRMIQKQSVTVAELDSHYQGEFAAVREQLSAEVLHLQGSLARTAERLEATSNLAIKQQETIKALLAQVEKQAGGLARIQDQISANEEALKLESSRRWRGDRDSQTRDASLDGRLDALENRISKP